jgi:hypothetical protein
VFSSTGLVGMHRELQDPVDLAVEASPWGIPVGIARSRLAEAIYHNYESGRVLGTGFLDLIRRVARGSVGQLRDSLHSKGGGWG